MQGNQPDTDKFGRDIVPFLFILIFIVVLVVLGITGH